MKKMIKMFCTECGEELQEDVNFCPNCGTNSTLYPDKESNLNIPGSLEKFQPANKEDPLTGEGYTPGNLHRSRRDFRNNRRSYGGCP